MVEPLTSNPQFAVTTSHLKQLREDGYTWVAEEIERLRAALKRIANGKLSDINTPLGPLHAAGIALQWEIDAKICREALAGVTDESLPADTPRMSRTADETLYPTSGNLVGDADETTAGHSHADNASPAGHSHAPEVIGGGNRLKAPDETTVHHPLCNSLTHPGFHCDCAIETKAEPPRKCKCGAGETVSGVLPCICGPDEPL